MMISGHQATTSVGASLGRRGEKGQRAAASPGPRLDLDASGPCQIERMMIGASAAASRPAIQVVRPFRNDDSVQATRERENEKLPGVAIETIIIPC